MNLFQFLGSQWANDLVVNIKRCIKPCVNGSLLCYMYGAFVSFLSLNASVFIHCNCLEKSNQHILQHILFHAPQQK